MVLSFSNSASGSLTFISFLSFFLHLFYCPEGRACLCFVVVDAAIEPGPTILMVRFHRVEEDFLLQL